MQGNLYENEDNVTEVLDIYKSSNPHFVLTKAQGNHHVHLNHPDNVWPLIKTFLETS